MSTPLVQISQHVWIWPHHPDKDRVASTVGVIVGDTETVLVDAGNSPQLARSIRSSLKTIKAPPISHIIYTHHHWDHVFGAHLFGVPAVAHVQCRTLLKAMRRKQWGDEALKTHERNPNLKLDFTAADWADFQIVLPEILFSQRRHLTVCGINLELRHVGGVHAADSIVVTAVEDAVMFLGDCYYPANLTEGPIDTDMLADLLNEPVETYIDGHRKPMSRAKLERILRLYHKPPRD